MVELPEPTYLPEAYRFLFESLENAVRLAGKEEKSGTERHITGQELLAGLEDRAREQFGPLAGEVWRAWGVRETLDWGRIVFQLVEQGKLSRQDSDTIEDFRDGFDFEESFVRNYEIRVPTGLEDADPA